MKIMVISDEVWNDKINGNNVLSNWFEKFPAEFANIYASPGLPFNRCCNKYFQVTDAMMIKSIIKRIPAGKILGEDERWCEDISTYNSTDVSGIGFLRKHCGNLLRLFKNIVWAKGKYNTDLLKRFIEEFKPDIIFSPRYATGKILRIEKMVLKYAQCPIVAFTGDNEYSLRRVELSPIFWINAFYRRKKLKDMIYNYSLYYTLSEEQKREYKKAFNIDIKLLMKCGKFNEEYKSKSVNSPIRIVYAGKLYMNRWKTLAKIGECLKKINFEHIKMVLDIYTRDIVNNKQLAALNDGKNIFFKGPINPEALKDIYEKADIALHVESFGLKQKYATRVSFSTKIIDCLASSCAVMAIAWKEHSGLTYLKRENAAICIDDINELQNVLEDLCENSNKILEYQYKAWKCGIMNHQAESVRKQLYDDFTEVIKRSKNAYEGSTN